MKSCRDDGHKNFENETNPAFFCLLWKNYIKPAPGLSGSFNSASEKKSKGLGFLHYKTWVSPATGAKKRTLNITIIAADGLEQGVLSRYPYVKIVHDGTETQRTPTSSKSVAVRSFLASGFVSHIPASQGHMLVTYI